MSDYWLLLQSMAFLILIILLAYFALRYGLRSLYRGQNGGHMQVLERVVLDPKSGSALILVRMGGQILLIGTAQGGVALLKTLSEQDLTNEGSGGFEDPPGFRDSFARILTNFRKGSSADGDGGGHKK